MAIPKPTGPLWDAVSAIHDPWPADDEALADHYSAALTSTKNAIADTIARNEQACTRSSDPMLGAAGVDRRAEFAASIAADLQGMLTQQADARSVVTRSTLIPTDRRTGGPTVVIRSLLRTTTTAS